MVFTGGVNLPILPLLPDSWPGYSRWSVLSSWAEGIVVQVMKGGEIIEPPAL